MNQWAASREWKSVRTFPWDAAQAVAPICLGLLTLVALVLAWRRADGALLATPPPQLLLGCGALTAVLAAAVRIPAVRLFRRNPRHTRARLWLAAPLPLVILVGLALQFPGQSAAVRLAFWGLLAMEETALAAACLARHGVPAPDRRAAGSSRAAPRIPAALPPAVAMPDLVMPPAATEIPDAETLLADGVTQQLTRMRLPDGGERLQGWLRVAFEPGQRTAGAHVAFCPPFSATPQCAAEQLDGPAARIRTQHVLSFGVRLELKLDEPAEKLSSVLVQIVAEAPG